jgi:hypothetical protein
LLHFRKKDVDGRDKPGHDAEYQSVNPNPDPSGNLTHPSTTVGSTAPHVAPTPSGSHGSSNQRVAGLEKPQWIDE